MRAPRSAWVVCAGAALLSLSSGGRIASAQDWAARSPPHADCSLSLHSRARGTRASEGSPCGFARGLAPVHGPTKLRAVTLQRKLLLGFSLMVVPALLV